MARKRRWAAGGGGWLVESTGAHAPVKSDEMQPMGDWGRGWGRFVGAGGNSAVLIGRGREMRAYPLKPVG
jgi:hypothetical protein